VLVFVGAVSGFYRFVYFISSPHGSNIRSSNLEVQQSLEKEKFKNFSEYVVEIASFFVSGLLFKK